MPIEVGDRVRYKDREGAVQAINGAMYADGFKGNSAIVEWARPKYWKGRHAEIALTMLTQQVKATKNGSKH